MNSKLKFASSNESKLLHNHSNWVQRMRSSASAKQLPYKGHNFSVALFLDVFKTTFFIFLMMSLMNGPPLH